MPDGKTQGVRYSFTQVAESLLDSEVKEGFVYVCDSEKVAQFKCPCGCKAVIYLPMVVGQKPCWKIVGDTITPSVDRKVGCRSHFLITNGIVDMKKK
jgi:hypothetical protein